MKNKRNCTQKKPAIAPARFIVKRGPRHTGLKQVTVPLEFNLSKKGNFQVILDGIRFIKMMEKDGRVYYSCEYRNKHKCKARLTQMPLQGTFHYSKDFNHSH